MVCCEKLIKMYLTESTDILFFYLQYYYKKTEKNMKTVRELFEKIRIKINDSSSFEFSDNELISYIHAGITQLEMLLLSNRVKFNITMLQTQSNICPVPDDLLEIYNIIINEKHVPLKNEYDIGYGYFVLNNHIVLPESNALIYYIKEFKRYRIDDEINMSASYVEYLYLYAVIKALSRLEFNMDKEEKELLQLSSMIVKTTVSKYGTYQLKRYNEFAL